MKKGLGLVEKYYINIMKIPEGKGAKGGRISKLYLFEDLFIFLKKLR